MYSSEIQAGNCHRFHTSFPKYVIRINLFVFMLVCVCLCECVRARARRHGSTNDRKPHARQPSLCVCEREFVCLHLFIYLYASTFQ